MRSVLAFALLAGLASAAIAGPYNPEEPIRYIPFDRVRGEILQQKGALLAPKGQLDPGSPRYRYLRSIDRLTAQVEGGTASTLDRVTLSACLLHVGEPRKARLVLLDSDQKHFMVMANLAAANHALGNLRDAIRFQEKALASWPAVWYAWSTNVNLFYFQCEQAYLRLLLSRQAEGRRGGTDPLPLDPIFPGFRLEDVAPSPKGFGKPPRYYAISGLPVEVRLTLPSNFADVVVQMLLWHPADLRLYWLYGELMALVNPPTGFRVLEDIAFSTDAGGAFLNLRNHRNALKAHLATSRLLRSFKGYWSLSATGMLLSAGLLTPGPAGAASELVGASMVLAGVPHWEKGQKPPERPVVPPAVVPPPPVAALPFNWRHVAVSFGFGAMAAALIGLQWQEWRRRWRRT